MSLQSPREGRLQGSVRWSANSEEHRVQWEGIDFLNSG